jgi:hypothetical protein
VPQPSCTCPLSTQNHMPATQQVDLSRLVCLTHNLTVQTTCQIHARKHLQHHHTRHCQDNSTTEQTACPWLCIFPARRNPRKYPIRFHCCMDTSSAHLALFWCSPCSSCCCMGAALLTTSQAMPRHMKQQSSCN